ncbi:ribosome maturation factor RimM [Candidatus Moduliflexota bacterium]
MGRITGVHGIAGEIKVESLTDFPERFNPGSCLLLELPDGGRGKTTIQTSRVHKGRFLLTLDGIADRTAAESLRGGGAEDRRRGDQKASRGGILPVSASGPDGCHR